MKEVEVKEPKIYISTREEEIKFPVVSAMINNILHYTGDVRLYDTEFPYAVFSQSTIFYMPPKLGEIIKENVAEGLTKELDIELNKAFMTRTRYIYVYFKKP